MNSSLGPPSGRGRGTTRRVVVGALGPDGRLAIAPQSPHPRLRRYFPHPEAGLGEGFNYRSDALSRRQPPGFSTSSGEKRAL